MLPNFLICGAQKSGTTALRIYLSQHPEIFMVDRELHFFDCDENFRKGVGWYERFFEDCGGEKAVGEKTPDYLYPLDAAERIYNVVPEVKLVFLFRNPVGRAYSHYWHHVRRGWETRSFKQAIEEEKEAEKPERYLENGKYIKYVKRYGQFFKQKQMLFLLTEDLKDNIEKTLVEVLDFLNVDKDFEFNDLERKNVGGVPRTKILAKIGGSKIIRRHRFLKDLIVRLNTKKGETPSMSEGSRVFLEDFFRSYNEELKDFAGLDLSKWSAKGE